MTTISITNRKGGVGKTSHALHIAAGLAAVGYRVGLIDTDSQGHIAVSLGIAPSDALYDVLVEGKPLDDTTFPIVNPDTYSTPDNPSRGELRVLSGSDKTYRIPHSVDMTDTFLMLKFIDRMKRAFDLSFVIIDTSPTLKDLDGYIYLATDAFLYVTEVEALSLQGLGKAVEQMTVAVEDRRSIMHRPTTILGVIPNKKRNTAVHDAKLEELQFVYGDFVWKPVRLNTHWSEASLNQQTLFRYAPSSEAAQEAWQVVERVVEAVRQWQRQNTKS